MRRLYIGIMLLFVNQVSACKHGPSSGLSSKAVSPKAIVDMDPSTSICDFHTTVAMGAPLEDGLKIVPANHPFIKYMGRIDCSNPAAPAFAFPGISIVAKFRGESIDIMLRDYGRGTPTTSNYYNVIIDHGEPIVLRADPALQIYPVARNLTPGVHTVELFKRIESGPGDAPGAGKGAFLGLRISGDGDLLPVAPRQRRLEFVGDSITCGYGNEISTDNPANFHYTTQSSNAFMAYGALTARALEADLMEVAYSGRGVWRNFDNHAGDKLPDMYLKTLPDEDKKISWDITRYIPDVLVINLGTNDFAQAGGDHVAFRNAYINFLAHLRSLYPQTTLIAAVGPTMTDNTPSGEKALSAIRQDLQQILKTRAAKGEQDLHYIEFPTQSSPYGADSHPTIATHQKMAQQLVSMIKQLKGW